ITREQMQRGTVIVNGVEHVGRMFEADPTIDRASVELCTELFTDDVMVAVANSMVKGYELALYRRHPSGIDRWYPHSVPVAGRQNDSQPAAAPAPKAAAAAKPKPKVETQPAAQEPTETAAQPVQEAQVKSEPKNNLNAPPITQAVPVTAPVASAVPPPPPITQAVPVTPPPTAQVPVTMPAPTAQIPVTAPPAAAELDATAIADEVAEAIKRAFAGI
ncbi:MAG TPA: hypothetical protein VHQ23_12825, partial [Ilumatobacteraceae bacterium]|nr:hypothetical protein [Ilumatobacteraceae bacterium]